MLDWVIVGGGIHGVTCASFLREGGLQSDRLAIIDPAPRLLSSWKRSTEAVGVDQLRSTHVHHVAKDPYSLIRFAKTREGRRLGKLRGKYGHPDLELFNAHADRTVDQMALHESHIQDRALDLNRREGVWKIETEQSSPLFSKQVLMATGCEQSIPDWYQGDLLKDHRIQMGFEAPSPQLNSSERILIVGAGMSGVQLARKYASIAPGRVTLLSRSAPKKSLFDSDPGWMGPKNQVGFQKIASYVKRREIISEARYPGSTPPRLLALLRSHLRDESLKFVKGSLEVVVPEASALRVFIGSDRESICREGRFDRIILATGLTKACPQRDLIQRLASRYQLPLANCGFPITCSYSHWGKSLYLSGTLAELQVGPVARNIVGARIAGESLLQYCHT